MAYKYKLVQENFEEADDIQSFVNSFKLEPIPELGFPRGLSLKELVNDYIRMFPVGSQMSEDAEMIIQLSLDMHGFDNYEVDSYLDSLNRQRIANLNEGEDPLQRYLTALLAKLKNEQSPEEKAQDDENARLGNTLMSPEEQGRKNLALEVLRRLKK
jgi:hypothetical protein